MRPPTSASWHEEMTFESTFGDRCAAADPSARCESGVPVVPPGRRHAGAAGPTRRASRLPRTKRTQPVVPTGGSGRRHPPTAAASERPPQATNCGSGVPAVPPGRRGDEEGRFDGGDEQHQPDHRVLLSSRVTYRGYDFRLRMVRTVWLPPHIRGLRWLPPPGGYPLTRDPPRIDAADRNGV